jgi:hypothetical protein
MQPVQLFAKPHPNPPRRKGPSGLSRNAYIRNNGSIKVCYLQEEYFEAHSFQEDVQKSLEGMTAKRGPSWVKERPFRAA